jgi:hypothetical protein
MGLIGISNYGLTEEPRAAKPAPVNRPRRNRFDVNTLEPPHKSNSIAFTATSADRRNSLRTGHSTARTFVGFGVTIAVHSQRREFVDLIVGNGLRAAPPFRSQQNDFVDLM